MSLFKHDEHDAIYTIKDKASKLHAIIAIYNTNLGPAIGGCRMLDYQDEQAALSDVMRLSKSMTYKAAMASVQYGGGKSVIIKPRVSFDREKLFNAFGHFVSQLHGRYITAIDSGTTMKDMRIVSNVTPYVTGYEQQISRNINPSYYTAKGVMQGIYAALQYTFNSIDLTEKKILIKGVGNVGHYLAESLSPLGANIYVTDIDKHKLTAISKQINCVTVNPTTMFDHEYDIICPCDTEYTVTKNNLSNIKTKIIIGATNNQLEEDELAHQLAKKNILYCPDYVVNSGGLIYVTKLYENTNTLIDNDLKNIYFSLLDIFDYASCYHL